MDLRSMLNDSSSVPPNQSHQNRQAPPPPHSYQSAGYPRQQQQQQPYPHAQSPHHASPPASQFAYPPPSPHGPPPLQHQYQYLQNPGSQGQPPVQYGGPQAPSHHQLPHTHPQQVMNVSTNNQGQFYPSQSPHHSHQYPPQYQRQVDNPSRNHQQQQQQQHHHPQQQQPQQKNPQRPLLLQTGSNERIVQPITTSTTSKQDRQREKDRDISISPKTRVPYLEDLDREPERELGPYQSNTGIQHQHQQPLQQQQPQQSGINNRPPSHHRSQSSGSTYSARRDNSMTPQTPSSHRERNVEMMEMDHDAGDRRWNNADNSRKGINGFEHGHREVSQAQQQQSQPSNGNSVVQTQLNSQHNQATTNTQRPPTANSVQQQSFQPPLQRSNPSTPQSLNRPPLPRPPSPKHSKEREIQPPPTPTESMSSSSGPPKKRPRQQDPPIFATKASRSLSNSPVISSRRNAPAQSPQGPATAQHQNAQSSLQRQASITAQTPSTHSGTASKPASTQAPGGHEHPCLGIWEPSFMGDSPSDEITRHVCEFLFNNIVKVEDRGIDWSNRGGPVFEIEAKLGHVIYKQSGQRIRLPVITETVLAQNADFVFKSSMTEQQHKTFNEYLNRAYTNSQRGPVQRPSQPPRSPSPSQDGSQNNSLTTHFPPPRVPMEYRHTKERDTFYELPASAFDTLPSILKNLLSHQRFKPKVRVTTDIKTGKVIARIIKARVEDLNIFSPKTAFDWRISVNLEMPYNGEIGEEKVGGGKGGGGERNKDRLSYKHLGKFSIDLTQVTPFDTTAKKEHELEVEIESSWVKQQGVSWMKGEESAYDELVKGFVNNVRILCRVVDPREGGLMGV